MFGNKLIEEQIIEGEKKDEKEWVKKKEFKKQNTHIDPIITFREKFDR